MGQMQFSSLKKFFVFSARGVKCARRKFIHCWKRRRRQSFKSRFQTHFPSLCSLMQHSISDNFVDTLCTAIDYPNKRSFNEYQALACRSRVLRSEMTRKTAQKLRNEFIKRPHATMTPRQRRMSKNTSINLRNDCSNQVSHSRLNMNTKLS